MSPVFRTFLSKNGVLLIFKALFYLGFFILLIGGMHRKTLKMRNDYFYARSLFEHGFLTNSRDKRPQRLAAFCISMFCGGVSNCQPVLNNTIKNQIIKAQKNPDKLFDALQFANNSFTTKSVAGSADVPMLGELNVLTYVFQQNFSCLVNIFPCFSDFFSLARKYSYVRNKLNHPLCKILEDTDMIPVLNFMEEICKWLDWKYFWDKSKTDIIKRITALRTSQVVIPISIQNINDMPFPETRIVCRSQEIAAIKDFIYGKPGAFRKQSSYCIYGYGGLGKTALVLEGIKEIIQDVIDRTTS